MGRPLQSFEEGDAMDLIDTRRFYIPIYFYTVNPSNNQHIEHPILQPASTRTELDCKCTPQYDPVCGSDWRRYTNYCFIWCRNKFLKSKDRETILACDCVTWQPIYKDYY